MRYYKTKKNKPRIFLRLILQKMQVNNRESCGFCASQSLLVRLLKGLTNYIVRSVLQQQEHNKSRCVNISLMSSIQNIHIHYVDSIITIRNVQMVKFFVHIRCEVTFQNLIVDNRYTVGKVAIVFQVKIYKRTYTNQDILYYTRYNLDAIVKLCKP